MGDKKKLLLAVVLIIVIGLNFIFSFQVLDYHREDAKRINIAGRQRMLIQKAAKQASMLFLEDVTIKQEEVLDTIEEFETNLDDLITGNQQRDLPPTTNQEILSQMKQVEKLWEPFKQQLKIVISPHLDQEKKRAALKKIAERNLNLLAKMNQTVNLYENHYRRRYLLIIQIVFGTMSFILFITIGNFIKLLETKQELKQHAVFDQLTELYNRRKFNELLEDELAREDRYETNLSVIMFDIDHFKQINDDYGHDIGDEVLVQLADLIKENKRKVDVLARWGGEEFLILARETDLEEAVKFAERLRKLIEDHNFLAGENITASFGVAEVKGRDNKASLLKKVDQAMYKAKESGRNQVANLQVEYY